MNKPSCPTVKHDGLHDEELPAVLKIPSSYQEMKGSAWEEWLMNHRKFRFDTPDGKFTAYNSQGYWKAQRRVNGKLRGQHLGQSHELIFSKLSAIARKLALRPANYEQAKVRPSRYRSEELTELKSHANCETEQQAMSQTVEVLKKERDDYRKKIDMLLNRIEELESQVLTPEKCDRILATLRVGRQSPLFKRVSKLLVEIYGHSWK
ncbi:MAG: hypothetical protein SVV88_15305 [Pseudomonadota bacterium]|nr:hypothetical protein [Pseudomonadota bacterium]